MYFSTNVEPQTSGKLQMLYAVIFTDNASRAHERQRLMPAHLSFLEQNCEHIRGAGPLLETNGIGAGGLWLVDAESHEAVERLVRDDPFWPTGLRKEFRILQWSQVFADGHRIGNRA
jgi:uncharacterized protein YciI